MEAVFTGGNLRFLSAALGCLGRFGEDVALFAQPSVASQGQEAYLRMSVINASSSAICQVFLRPAFFTAFTLAPDQKALNAKLPVRTLHSCFRNRASDRRLLSCALNSVVDQGVSKMVVVLKYVEHLVITHDITYSSEQGLVPVAEVGPHCIRLSHGTVKAWVQQLLAVPTAVGPNGSQSHKVGEVTLYVSPAQCELLVHHEELPTTTHRKVSLSTRTGISTSVTMEPDSFIKYRVSREELLTFPLKEFKAGLLLADQLMVGVDLRFSMGGEPLFLTLSYLAGIKATLVLATSTYSVVELDQNRKNPNQPGRSPPPRVSSQSDDEGSSLFGQSRLNSTQPRASRRYSTTPLDDPPGTRPTPVPRKGPLPSLRETPKESTPRPARPAPGPLTSFDTRGHEPNEAEADVAMQDEPLFRGLSQPSSQPQWDHQANPSTDDDEMQPLPEDERPLTLAAASSHYSDPPARSSHPPTQAARDPNLQDAARDPAEDSLLNVDLDALTRAANSAAPSRRPRPRPRIRSNPSLNRRGDAMLPPANPARDEAGWPNSRDSQGDSLDSQRQQDYAQVTMRVYEASSASPEPMEWTDAPGPSQAAGSASGGALGLDEVEDAYDQLGEEGEEDMTLADTQLGPTPIPNPYQPQFGS